MQTEPFFWRDLIFWLSSGGVLCVLESGGAASVTDANGDEVGSLGMEMCHWFHLALRVICNVM